MNARERRAMLLGGLAALAYFAVLGGAIYAAIHFVVKFW